MKPIVVLSAPSNLGLGPRGVSGVDLAPAALLGANLLNALNAADGGVVPAPLPSNVFDPAVGILNQSEIRYYSLALADRVEKLIKDNFVVVLGGDCSIVLGCLLGLRRLGRYGLLYLDGHASFYGPGTSVTGEVADMDLAIATGRGPKLLTELYPSSPLVQERDVVVMGCRDLDEAVADGSEDIRKTGIRIVDAASIRQHSRQQRAGMPVRMGLSHFEHSLAGIWIHLDVDVLDHHFMPAVDWNLAGEGLTLPDLSVVLSEVLEKSNVVGMDITIYNPKLDPTGQHAVNIVNCLAREFANRV